MSRIAETDGRKEIAGRRVRWDEQRAKDAYARGLWVRETPADALKKAARETPDRLLIVDGDKRVTCKSLYDESMSLAQAMLARAPVGSAVSFMLPNWYESATIYLAADFAGMVVNPILPSLRDHDTAFILKDIDTRLIFAPANFRKFDYAGMFSRITESMDNPPQIILLRGDAGPHTSYEAMLAEKHPPKPLPTIEPDAMWMVMFTSGTTGRPKGVMHTHNSLHALICQLREFWHIAPNDAYFVPSPIGHIGGSIYVFEMPLLAGTRAVLADTWNGEEALPIIERERCTHMAGAPIFLDGLVAAARKAGTRMPYFKVFCCGGASITPASIQAGIETFEKAIVTRVYGSTEVPVITVGSQTFGDVKHASETEGRTAYAEMKLVDANGKTITGGEGEIYARGPQMLVGYLHAEDEAKSFDAEGFYKSGDLGTMVDGEYLVISGREKDLIIRNGENIAPKEIEDILLAHPDVQEIAIVGLPDPKTGERSVAVVVSKRPPGPDVASLTAFLNNLGVAKFKFPEEVVLWDALPKNDAGKVLKTHIRATLKSARVAGAIAVCFSALSFAQLMLVPGVNL
jgi:acyl-CoA synthetase (AMP-forming)/AMP-acid ligase II